MKKSKDILKRLKSLGSLKNKEGMTRFGINPQKNYGVTIPDLRKIAKGIGKDHHLALELWKSGIHEARILASMIDDWEKVTEKQMNQWVADFDSWDVCDQCCLNLLDKVKFVDQKIKAYAKAREEFVKRTAFTLIACLAFHDKELKDKDFEKYFKIIKDAVTDERNFVRKAVNWALRQIGKRNKSLNKKAIKVAQDILKTYKDNKVARWIANDALRELKSKQVQNRLTHSLA